MHRIKSHPHRCSHKILKSHHIFTTSAYDYLKSSTEEREEMENQASFSYAWSMIISCLLSACHCDCHVGISTFRSCDEGGVIPGLESRRACPLHHRSRTVGKWKYSADVQYHLRGKWQRMQKVFLHFDHKICQRSTDLRRQNAFTSKSFVQSLTSNENTM